MFRVCGYVQDVRYIASEHMDVRRDCVNCALRVNGYAAQSIRFAWQMGFYFKLLSGEWRCGGGIAYQDTPRVRPCRLFLDFLSRKVLVGNTTTPASTSM